MAMVATVDTVKFQEKNIQEKSMNNHDNLINPHRIHGIGIWVFPQIGGNPPKS